MGSVTKGREMAGLAQNEAMVHQQFQDSGKAIELTFEYKLEILLTYLNRQYQNQVFYRQSRAKFCYHNYLV